LRLLAVLALGFGAAAFLVAGAFLGAAALAFDAVFFGAAASVVVFLGRPGDLAATAFYTEIRLVQKWLRVRVKFWYIPWERRASCQQQASRMQSSLQA